MIVFVNCIGFGICSTDARWKIPATYTIVEVLDLTTVETTSKSYRDKLRNPFAIFRSTKLVDLR